MHDPRDYFTTHRGKTKLTSHRQHRLLHARNLPHSHYEWRVDHYEYKREKLGAPPHRKKMRQKKLKLHMRGR